MSDEIEHFTESELTALARMLVVLLGADGKVSAEEQDAVRDFARRVRLGERVAQSPYRESTLDSGDGVATFQPYLDRALDLLKSESDFLAAAQTITRQDTREAIYAALFDVAAADVIDRAEWSLLTKLVDLWDIEAS
jgi:hypothetical protein